jgi:hypothetical protein
MNFPTGKWIDVVLGMAAGTVSFLALQGWNLGKDLYRERKLRRALWTEIEELPPWLLRNNKTFECMIQLSCLEELANNGPVPLPIQVHAEHFPEINLTLSRLQRVSVTAIYNLIYRINSDIQKIIELNGKCADDGDQMQEFRRVLDSAYRNSSHALLLIRLHNENRKDLTAVTMTSVTDKLMWELQKRNDEDLLKLAAEAKKEGTAAIREKYHDGAVSVDQVARLPPPVVGRFYFDSTGAKYKCVEVSDEMVTWFQLETKIGAITFDAIVRQSLDSLRCYEITDAEEVGRLERRITALTRNNDPVR